MKSTENLGSMSYPLGFVAGDKVTRQDVSNFRDTVNTDAASVCQGIVTALAAQKLTGTIKQSGNLWLITVGSATSASAMLEEAVADDPPANSNISITVNSADLAPTINALNSFFGNWRVVAGFIATTATVVGAILALRVTRR